MAGHAAASHEKPLVESHKSNLTPALAARQAYFPRAVFGFQFPVFGFQFPDISGSFAA
jgi:hypothetical protein